MHRRVVLQANPTKEVQNGIGAKIMEEEQKGFGIVYWRKVIERML
jgi:hypothetical protein